MRLSVWKQREWHHRVLICQTRMNLLHGSTRSIRYEAAEKDWAHPFITSAGSPPHPAGLSAPSSPVCENANRLVTGTQKQIHISHPIFPTSTITSSCIFLSQKVALNATCGVACFTKQDLYWQYDHVAAASPSRAACSSSWISLKTWQGFWQCHHRLKERMQRIKMSDFPIASSCLHSCPESGNV